MRPLPLLLLLTAACATPAWTPADPSGAVVCQAHETRPWVSTMYLRRSASGGADASLRVNHEGTWVLSEDSTPGVYDVTIASGAVGPDGVLLSLPPTLFDGATGVWMADGVCTAGDETVPSKPRDLGEELAKAHAEWEERSPTKQAARWITQTIFSQEKGDCACG